ncbi:conserved hypothetical protein [Streptomyces misionensis JCM 4497]
MLGVQWWAWSPDEHIYARSGCTPPRPSVGGGRGLPEGPGPRHITDGYGYRGAWRRPCARRAQSGHDDPGPQVTRVAASGAHREGPDLPLAHGARGWRAAARGRRLAGLRRAVPRSRPHAMAGPRRDDHALSAGDRLHPAPRRLRQRRPAADPQPVPGDQPALGRGGGPALQLHERGAGQVRHQIPAVGRPGLAARPQEGRAAGGERGPALGLGKPRDRRRGLRLRRAHRARRRRRADPGVVRQGHGRPPRNPGPAREGRVRPGGDDGPLGLRAGGAGRGGGRAAGDPAGDERVTPGRGGPAGKSSSPPSSGGFRGQARPVSARPSAPRVVSVRSAPPVSGPAGRQRARSSSKGAGRAQGAEGDCPRPVPDADRHMDEGHPRGGRGSGGAPCSVGAVVRCPRPPRGRA